MNELSRHIEILLLDNDCVIVPGFGGFMAHYVTAEYVEDAGLFYPPQRTLGFNPQLQLNDSLLAQSYVEAYDISYPEAVRKIESEVEEIRQTLTLNGVYEFHGIGSITLLSSGKYDFVPCQAGLLTPSLYALDSFNFDLIDKALVKSVEQATTQEGENEETPDTLFIETEEPVEEEEGLRIKFTTLRNILAVAMILLFFVFASIPAGIGSGNIQKCSLIDTELISSIIAPAPTVVKTAPVKTVTDTNNAASNESKAEEKQPSVPESYYTIVLASRVSQKGAEDFVNNLKHNGLNDACIHGSKSSRKVIYGKYKSDDEAHKVLSSLRGKNDEFAEAWTTEIHN